MNLLLVFPLQNNNLSIYFASFLLGFICGSIPFGYIIARLKKVDITQIGSKNIGSTNVYRTFGLVYAIPVLILDLAKGFLPVFFASVFGLIPVVVGLGAILGHIFTPWLSFRGGKGVATTIGVMSALMPLALLCGIGIFMATLLIFSYISLASMSFAVSLPIFAVSLYRSDRFLLILSLIIALLILVRHKDNIKRIGNRTEPRISLIKLPRIRT